ncbi:MAG: hypothetical protein PF505_15055, partial [Vallitaleaceae bacterium]|nr:hypothetical protein [Vallitaleaceae bacterium]
MSSDKTTQEDHDIQASPILKKVKMRATYTAVMFIIIMVIPLFFVLIFGQNDISTRENRALNKLPNI